jgi:hypothetical protein
MTGENGWIPPDRSWVFGILSNFIFRHGHGFSAFMLLQVLVLVGLIEGSRSLFKGLPLAHLAWAATATVVALDPLLELYTRFFMSDLLALSCFVAVILCVVRLMRAETSGIATVGLCCAIVLATICAVFLRVAYAPIVFLTLILSSLLLGSGLGRHRLLVLALAIMGPTVAIGSVMGANRIVFAQYFPGEVFVTKLSGVFLAGVFAPALAPSDFAHAGIALTTQEFRALDLGNYDKRAVQVWGPAANYTAAVDRAASKLVRSALLRNPLAIATVYVRSALLYLQPSEWSRTLSGEMGLSRPLPDYFVTFANKVSVLKVTPDMTEIRSALIRGYILVVALYPLQITLGLFAGVYLVWRHGRAPRFVVPFTALLADLASAPLYSNYVIPRYILGAILLSYLLMGLAIAAGRPRAIPHQTPS